MRVYVLCSWTAGHTGSTGYVRVYAFLFADVVLAIPELYGRFLHNHFSDPESDYGGLLGSTTATQRYKGRLCGIRTHEIADPCESCLYRYNPGDPRARWQIPTQQLDRFWIRLRDIVGLDAIYAKV